MRALLFALVCVGAVDRSTHLIINQSMDPSASQRSGCRSSHRHIMRALRTEGKSCAGIHPEPLRCDSDVEGRRRASEGVRSMNQQSNQAAKRERKGRSDLHGTNWLAWGVPLRDAFLPFRFEPLRLSVNIQMFKNGTARGRRTQSSSRRKELMGGGGVLPLRLTLFSSSAFACLGFDFDWPVGVRLYD